MNTYIKTKDGKEWILWSDEIEAQEVILIPLSECDHSGNYDPEFSTTQIYTYSDIEHRMPYREYFESIRENFFKNNQNIS